MENVPRYSIPYRVPTHIHLRESHRARAPDNGTDHQTNNTHDVFRHKTWQGVNTTVEHERTANALLLFYEKVQPKGCRHPEGDAAGATAGAGGNRMSNGEHDGDQEMGDSAEAVAAQADESNGGGDENAAPSPPPPPQGFPSGGAGDKGTTGDSGGVDAEAKERGSLVPPPAADNMSPVTTESDPDGPPPPPPVGKGGGSAESKLEVVGFGGKAGAGAVPLLDGVEAYAEEVWEANVQYMLNSYVFDTEFHHFLRRVCERGGEGEGGEGSSLRGDIKLGFCWGYGVSGVGVSNPPHRQNNTFLATGVWREGVWSPNLFVVFTFLYHGRGHARVGGGGGCSGQCRECYLAVLLAGSAGSARLASAFGWVCF